jgi:prepilin signal peptidase PulO-like enzyme (type II secretory pathway)
MVTTILIIAFLGSAGGVALNYLADHLPALSLRASGQAAPSSPLPRSVLSYLPWPKTCPGRSQWIILRYRLVQLLMPLAAIWLWLNNSHTLSFILNLLILVYLGMIIVIDIEHRLILFPTILAGALLCLAAGWARLGITNSLMGGLAAILVSLIIFAMGGLFTTLLGRVHHRKIEEVAFGFGDVLLSGVIGLMIGWPQILHSLFVTILAAGLFSLIYLLILFTLGRYSLGKGLPFAPLLILGAIWVSYF